MQRVDIVAYVSRVALAMSLLGETSFKTAAYRRAAQAVAAMSEEAWQDWLAETGAPPPGVGARIQARLRSLASEGHATDLEALLVRIPPGLFDLLKIRGLGARRVHTLWQDAGIVTLRQLERACHRGHLARLTGFGEALQAQLGHEIRHARRMRGRWLRHTAGRFADEREDALRRIKGWVRMERAGEFRRAHETVNEIVWVISAEQPPVFLGRLATLEGTSLPSSEVPDTVVLKLPDTPTARFVVVRNSHFAARLFLATGSPAHVRAVLGRLDAGPGDELTWLPESEEEIYARAGLAYVPPELREGRGEVEAAADGTLPRLITAGDLKGVLHVHTNWSDGRASIAQMVSEAQSIGWSYIGIADHSQAAFYANGLTAERLRRQLAEIEKVQADFPEVRIFRGIECDILPDGRLDLDDDALEMLDYVVVSVHSVMRMDCDTMTRRLVRAIQHPHATLLGHPSGRLLLEREGYDVDWERLFEAVADAGKAIEFNAPPERLDLDWRLMRDATRLGIPICINPDAHQLESLRNVFPGLDTARKGWLTPGQVLNARTADELHAYLSGDREA